MAKKKKRYGYKDGDENARFAPGGSAASEWEEEQRQSFTMGRTINPSDTSKRFNTEQDIENYKPIKTETYQSYMASKLAQAKANNPKSKVHITANDLSSYSNARAKLYNIDPTAELKSQSEFTSQYKSSVDKKSRLNDMVQLAQGLDLGSTQDLVRKSYNDLNAVKNLANTRTNAEGLLKRVEEYRKLYGDSKELKVLEDRAKGIADYINANAKGGSAVSQAAYEELQAPTIQKKEEVRAKYNAINNANIEEKYGKAGDLGYEGVKNIKAETPAEADWKEEKQLQLDPFKKYEDNKKEIESLENDGKMPLGNQNGKGYEDEQEAKNDRINALREQNTQILSQYAEDIIAKANLTDDERRKLETGRSFDLSDNEFRWDIGDKAKNEVTLNRKEMIDTLTKRGISEEEASLLLDYENELDKENERQAAINAGELRRRTDSELGNLTEDIARTIGQPIISPLERVMGVSGEYAHAEQLGRQQAREKYYEDDAIGKALYDFGETAGTIVGSSLLGGAAAVPFTTKAVEDSYYNALDKGASEEDAMNYAATNGIMTGIIYGIGLKGVNKLLSKSVKGSVVEGLAKEIVEGKPTSSLGKAIIKNVGTNAVKEGGIFAGLTTTTQVADTLNQVINLGNKSDFNQMVEAYKQQGMSEDEAWQNTVLDISKQIGQGALESFASGAIMGAGGALIGSARQAKTYNEMRDRAETLKGEYEKFTADTTSPYFENVTDQAELESQYRQKAKELHPDVAEGNEEAFNQLVQDKQRIEGILTGERSNEARTAIDNWENFVNQARDILGLERVLTTKEREGFVSDYKDIKTKLLETKTEVEKSNADQEVKDEVINNIDNEIARVDTAVEATADIVVPEENAIGKSKSGKPIYIDEVNGTDVTFVDSEGKKVTDYELDDTPQTELMELAIDKDYNTDTTKSMIKGFELANTDNVEAYADNYDVFYAAGKDSSIKNFKDALAKAPELTSALEIVGTDAAGKAFSEGRKQVSPLQQKGLTKLPKGKFTNDTGKTNAATEYAEMFAIFSGGDVVATENPEKFISSKVEPGSIRGVYIEPEGKIIIDTKYTSFIRALNHEFGHLTDNFALDEAEAVSDACMKFARESLGIKGVDDAIKNLQETYEVNGQEISYTEAQNEFIKNIIGTAMASPEGIEGLLNEFAKDEKISDAKKQSIIEKFLDWIKGLITRLKELAKAGGKYEDTEFVAANKEQRQEIINKQIDALKATREILEGLDKELKGETTTEEKFSMEKPVEETKDLVAVHNLSARQLIDNLELGGLPMPSIAITKGKMGHSAFGDISIVFDKSVIDPEKADNAVYTADAYTPTFPNDRVEYKLNESKLKDAAEKLGTSASMLEANIGESKERDINTVKTLPGVEQKFLESVNYKPSMIKPDYGSLYFDEIVDELGTENIDDITNITKAKRILDKVLPTDSSQKTITRNMNKSVKNRYINVIENLNTPEKAEDWGVNSGEKLVEDFKKDIEVAKGNYELVKDRKAEYDYIQKHDKEFTNFVENALSEAYGKKYLRNDKDYLTNRGDRRSFESLHDSYNLANIVKYMKKDVEQGHGGMLGGRSFTGSRAKKLESIAEIKSMAKKLAKRDANYEETREKISNTFNDITFSKIPSDTDNFYVFSTATEIQDIIIDALDNYTNAVDIEKYINKKIKDFSNIKEFTHNDVQKLLELNKLADSLTSEYFEAKPRRAITNQELRDSALVIVPENETETINKLKDYDINYKTYEPGNDEERLALQNDSNLKFSLTNDDNKGELVEDIPDVLDESGADEDDKGRKLTKDQVEYFKNSKARLDGNLETTYHGTVSDFTVFDRQFANVEGDWGKGYYFTNDINDVERNYANEEGADLTNKIERRAEQLEYNDELDREESLARARKEFIKSDARYIEAYLNITNPVYIDKAHPTLLLEDWEDYLTYDRSEYESDEDYWEGAMQDIDENLFVDIANDLENNIGITSEESSQAIGVLAQAIYEGGITAQSLKDQLNEFDIGDENGDLANNEIARQIIESLGYDGIIDYTVSDKFKNMGLHPDVTHFIVFNSNQAKNIDNKQPTTNDDIRFSIEKREDDEIEVDARERELKDANNVLANTMQELYDRKLNNDSATKIARDMKKNFNIDLATRIIKEQLLKVTDAIARAKGNIKTSEVQNAAADFIKNMMRYSKGEIDEYNQSILDNIKKTPILLSDELKSEIQDYGYWFRANRGNMKIRNNGIPLDRQWVEWADQYPAIFDATISDKDQPYELEKIINTLSEGIPFDDRPEAMEAYKTDLLLKIARQLDINNRNITKAYNRVARLINNDYKKRVREALKEQREYFNAEIAQMKLNETLRGREQRIRKETTKARQDNVKLASKIKRSLLKPTVKNRVPSVLQQPLLDFIRVIDAGEQRRIEYYNKQLEKLTDQLKYATGSQYDEILRQIDDIKTKKGEVDLDSAFIALENAYKKSAEELEANGDFSQPLLDSLSEITGKRGFSDTAKEAMKSAAESFGGRSINDLYLPEQKELNRVLRMLQTEIKNYNKIIDNSIIGKDGRALHISEIVKEGASQIRLRASELIGSDNKVKRTVGKLINKKRDFSTKNLRPDVVFKKLFGYHKDNLGGQIYDMLEQGYIDEQETKRLAINELQTMFDSKEDRKNAADIQKYDSKHLYDVGIENSKGKKVLLPMSMIIQLKLHLNNERNRAHLIGGGLTVPNLDEYFKTGYGLDTQQQIIKGTDARVNAINKKIYKELNSETPDFEKIKNWDMDIEQILSEGDAFAYKLEQNIDKILTDWGRKYIDVHYKIFDGILKKELNRVTQLRFGVDQAIEDKYARLISDKAYLKATNDGDVGIELNQEQAGFMQQRTGARNPIILESCLNADLSQIDKSARYVGFMIPQHNLNRILKFTTDTEDGDKINLTKVIQQNYPTALDYIDDLKLSVFGGKPRAQHGTAMSTIMSLRAIEGLVANVNVELLQAASYPLAASEIRYSSLLKALAKGGKKGRPISRADRELIDKHTPLLWSRAADSMTEVEAAMNNKTLIGRAYSKLANNKYGAYLVGRIPKIDNATVGRLWYAAEYDVKQDIKDYNLNIKVGSEEYYDEVAKKFNKLTTTTQPMYDPLHRNEYQRSNNPIVKMLEMFKTVLVQAYNTVYDKQSTYQQYYEDYKNGDYGTTKEDVKNARKERNRAITSWILSMSMVAAIRAVIYGTLYHQAQDAIRDENGDISADRVAKYYADSLVNSFAGAFLLGSDLMEAFETATDKIAGYDNKYHNEFSIAAVDMINDAFDIIKNAPDLRDENKRDRYLKNTFNTLVRTTGMPYKNTKRLVDGIFGMVEDFADNGEFDYSNELEGSQKLRKWAKGELEQKQVKDEMTTQKVGNAVKKVYLDKDITKEQAIKKLEESGLYKGTSNRSLSSVLEGKVEKWDIDSYKDEYLSTLTSGGAETAESRAVIQKITNLPYNNAFYSDSSRSHYKDYKSSYEKLLEYIKKWKKSEQ